MNPALQEEDIDIYASTATTIQEPQGVTYSQGVSVGRVVPAKFWNWLFKAITKRIHESFQDMYSFFTELKNALLFAGITPSASDNTQLTQAASSFAQQDIFASVHNYMYNHSILVAPVFETDDPQYPIITLADSVNPSKHLLFECVKKSLGGSDPAWYKMNYASRQYFSNDFQHWTKVTSANPCYFDPATQKYYSFTCYPIENPDTMQYDEYYFEWNSYLSPIDMQSKHEVYTETYMPDISEGTPLIHVPVASTWEDVEGNYFTAVIVPSGKIAVCSNAGIQWFDKPANSSDYYRIDAINFSIQEALVTQDTVYIGNLKLVMHPALSDWQLSTVFDNIIDEVDSAGFGPANIKAVKLSNDSIAFAPEGGGHLVEAAAGKILTTGGDLLSIPEGLILSNATYQSSALGAVIAESITERNKFYFSTDGITFTLLPLQLGLNSAGYTSPFLAVAYYRHICVLYDRVSHKLYAASQLSGNLEDYIVLYKAEGVASFDYMDFIDDDGTLVFQPSTQGAHITYDLCKHTHKLLFNGFSVPYNTYNRTYREVSIAGSNMPVMFINGRLFCNAHYCRPASSLNSTDYAIMLKDNRVHDFTLYRY